MAKNIILAFFTIILLSSLVSAAVSPLVVLSKNKWAADLYFTEGGELKQEVLSKMNAQADKVPAELLAIFANKKLNIYVILDDGSVMEFYARTGAKSVDAVAKGVRQGADIEIRLSEPTVDRIYNSKDPVPEIVKAISSGEINYKGLTTEGQISSTAVNAGAGLFSFIDGVINFIKSFFK